MNQIIKDLIDKRDKAMDDLRDANRQKYELQMKVDQYTRAIIAQCKWEFERGSIQTPK